MTPTEYKERAERLNICYSLEEQATGPEVSQYTTPSHLRIQKSWMQQISEAIDKACRFMLETQHPDGYWWLELESNVSITAEYMMMLHLMQCVDHEREQAMVRYLLNQQGMNGAWGLYYGDGGDLSTTVEAYFALKLAGGDPESLPMRKARDFVLDRGGIEATRVFSKIWLALFSQYDWPKVPSMPVEMVLIPPHFFFSIYEFSSWARSTVVPLSVIMTLRPRVALPPDKSIAELYVPALECAASHGNSPIHKLFYVLDRMLKWAERHPLPRLRRKALHAVEKWILDHEEATGDWGGIQPAMVNSVLALYYLGYSTDHPAVTKGLKALENFCLDDEQGLRLQACVSPVWDTALNCLALLDAGIPADQPALQKAAAWLIDNQILSGGDWQIKNCCPPGGWAFEFCNNHYPDVDDSAVVLMALQQLRPGTCASAESCKKRGLEWCISMQSRNGGWAAFDKDNLLTILNKIPFADHGAMVDFPTADITGRMLEAMASFGFDRSAKEVRNGIRFIMKEQEPDGCWWGRWGVNYIYGTWCVLRGLIAIGENPRQPYIQAAARWLRDHQNSDGGWGETCESYRNPALRGQGESTPSQTAWAVMGLMLTGEAESPAVRRGIQFLLNRLQEDGSWEELHYTGTGFPGHFYIRYHDYRNCFPLMALGKYRQAMNKD